MLLATLLFNHPHHLTGDQTVLTYCKSTVRAEQPLYWFSLEQHCSETWFLPHTLLTFIILHSMWKSISSSTENQTKYSHWAWPHHPQWTASLCRDSLTAQGGGKRRKKNGFKFSLQGGKAPLCFQVYPTIWEESLPCPIKQNTNKQESQHMLRLQGQGHVLLIGSSRQSRFYWEEREFLSLHQLICQSGKWSSHSASLLSVAHAVLQQEQAVKLDGASVLCYLPSATPCKGCLKQHPGRQDNILDSSAAGLDSDTSFTPLRTGNLWRTQMPWT